MKKRPQFISVHNDGESLDFPRSGLLEEYKRRENDKYLNSVGGANGSGGSMNKIIYDCVDPSTFYEAGTYFEDSSDYTKNVNA